MEWNRKEIFREPGCFKVDYEEINSVPFLHFVLLTKKPTSSLFKMLQILCEEICSVLYEQYFDYVYSYTKENNRAVIRFAKMLGFKEVCTKEGYIILRKVI